MCIDGDRVPRQFLTPKRATARSLIFFSFLVYKGVERSSVNGYEWAGVKSQDCLALVFINSAHEPIDKSMDRPYLRPQQKDERLISL